MLAGAWPFTARSGKATALASSCFPGESGEASAGDAPSATAVTAAARGKIGDLAQGDVTSDGPDGRHRQGKKYADDEGEVRGPFGRMLDGRPGHRARLPSSSALGEFTHWSLRKMAAYLGLMPRPVATRREQLPTDPAYLPDQLPVNPDLE